MMQLVKFAAVPIWKRDVVDSPKHYVTIEIISSDAIILEKKSKGWVFFCLASIIMREKSSKHWLRKIDIQVLSYADGGEWVQVVPIHGWHKIVHISSTPINV
mgnify:CR=1 FL=1